MRRDRDDRNRDSGRDSNGELNNNVDRSRGRRDGLEDYSPERRHPEVLDTLPPPRPRPGRGTSDGSADN